jgi:hypothetical protein
MADRQGLALDYAARGLPVFPCYEPVNGGRCSCGKAECQSPAKHPRTEHGALDATAALGAVAAWWRRWPEANIGLPTGAAFVVLDADPKAGGDETLHGLQETHGPLPPTWRVLTGGGGLHAFFQPVPGLRNSAGLLGPGLDIRAEGGYVIAPGSTHASGREYVWEIGFGPDDGVPLAEMPDWMRERLLRPRGSGDAATDEEWITRLSGAPEGRRNETATQLAGHLARKGLTAGEIGEILLGFGARCAPPIGREEAAAFRDLARRIWEKEQARREPRAETAVAIRGLTLAEILAVDPATVQTRYLVEPWMPLGINALSSKPGVGKSKLGLDLCLARATGGRWLGFPVEPGPALYWSGEQGEDEDKRTVQALCRGRGVDDPALAPHYFEVVTDPPLRFAEPRMLAYVLARAAAHPGLLVVIDSHRRAFEGEEISSEAADRFFRTALVPLRAAGATVLTLAHPPKTSGQQRTIADENMIRGSGDWLAQLGAFLVLRPAGRTRTDDRTETITMRLIHAKARAGPMAPPLLVALHVTGDLTPRVTFRFSAEAAGDEAPELRTATLAVALLAEEHQRLSRQTLVEGLSAKGHGRPLAEKAIQRCLDLDVLRGPLSKEEKLRGERGHWYVFVRPLPTPPSPEAPLHAPEAPEDDDVPF